MATAQLRRLVTNRHTEARIAEARLRGNLRTIHDDGGMSAVMKAVGRALSDLVREKRDGGWVA